MYKRQVAVGARGGAYLFDAATGQELEQLVPAGGPPVGGSGVAVIDGGFGLAVDVGADRVVVGARTANGSSLYSGAAYLFDTGGNELHKLNGGPAWSHFGGSVGIDGDTVVIGARYASPNGKDSGAAYLFDAFTGQQTKTLVPNDGHTFAEFGSSVGVDGQHVVVGAEQDNAGGFSAGAAYLYGAQSGDPVVKLGVSDGAPLDDLGGAVAVGGGVLVAGAARDDDLGDASGAAYVFDAAGTATAMAECFGNDGTLTQVGGIPVAGQTLVYRVDGAQPGATQALLLVSGAPAPGWPACGVDLGGAGELLVDLAPASQLFTAAAPWAGSPVDFPVAVPPLSGLVGFHFYVQGAFLAPFSPLEPVRLTHGLEVVLGGYL